MKTILQLIRWKNLLIVAATQVLTWYGLILPLMKHLNVTPAMGWDDIFLLVWATIFVTASGNIINNIFDVKTDSINNKKNPIGKDIPLKRAKSLYWFTTLHGFMLGEILAVRIGSYQSGFIFLFISGLLWIYSSKLKRTPIFGNVLIAFLTSSVLLILWFFEIMAQIPIIEYFPISKEAFSTIGFWVLGYAAFAFFINLLREMVKDMEDEVGDRQASFNTLPVLVGIKKTNIVYLTTTIIVMGFTFLIQYLSKTLGHNLLYIFGFFPQFALVFILSKVNKRDYKRASFFLKILMVVGLLSILYIPFYYAR